LSGNSRISQHQVLGSGSKKDNSVNKPTVGISACLLGHCVRYNGEHKRHDWIVNEFGKQVDFVPICPEIEMGLGVPRKTLRLIIRDSQTRMVLNESGEDLTDLALSSSRRILSKLPRMDGYIFKKDSPSCGLSGVKLYTPDGNCGTGGTGIFSQEFRKSFAGIPVIEESDLNVLEAQAHFRNAVLKAAREHSTT